MYRSLDLEPISQWGIFPEDCCPLTIVGPCSAESEIQVITTAKLLKDRGFNVFRAGIWKPRTYPGSFEGIGEKGLFWLEKVRSELGMKICTEVANTEHIEKCLYHNLDLLWIGARTTANPFMMQEIADSLKGTDIPVLVKNPVNQEIGLWIGAMERLNRAGIRKIGVIHRGFSTLDKIIYRNNPGWQTAIELRAMYPELPFFADPSHISGCTKYIYSLSQRALDLGLEGLMIESHYSPKDALSDAAQQLTPQELFEMFNKLVVRQKDSNNIEYKENIENLREQIDVIDETILLNLKSRMDISRKIGEYKKHHNIAILQTDRWDNLLDEVVLKGSEYGLSEEFLRDIFNSIHEHSVQAQNEILSEHSLD